MTKMSDNEHHFLFDRGGQIYDFYVRMQRLGVTDVSVIHELAVEFGIIAMEPSNERRTKDG